MHILVEATHFYEWFPILNDDGTPGQPREDEFNLHFESDGTTPKMDGNGNQLRTPKKTVRISHTGQWLRVQNVKVSGPDPRFGGRPVTGHVINPPEAEIADHLAHFAREGKPKTRNAVIAWFIGDHILHGHGHPIHYTNITVEGAQRPTGETNEDGTPKYIDDSKEIENYLKAVFEVKPFEEHPEYADHVAAQAKIGDNSDNSN